MDYRIIKENDTHYKLEINSNLSSIIYKSILKLNFLSFPIIYGNYFFFNSMSVETLKENLNKYDNGLLTYEKSIHLMACISKQIIILQENGFTFSGFNLDDIIVVDNEYFIVVSAHNLYNFNKDNDLFLINSFIINPFFSSPELISQKSLPFYLHYKSCYYSLASLVIYCLINNSDNNLIVYKNDMEIDTILKYIINTKLYWFLKRCLNKNIEERKLLYV
jgi:hypothetical protein